MKPVLALVAAALLGLTGSGTLHMDESNDTALNNEDVESESSRYAVEQVAFEMFREFYVGAGAGLNDAVSCGWQEHAQS